MTAPDTPETIETGGHSPPVIAFVDDYFLAKDLPFLFGTDAENAPPLVLRVKNGIVTERTDDEL